MLLAATASSLWKCLDNDGKELWRGCFERSASHGVLTSLGAASNRYFLVVSPVSAFWLFRLWELPVLVAAVCDDDMKEDMDDLVDGLDDLAELDGLDDPDDLDDLEGVASVIFKFKWAVETDMTRPRYAVPVPP
jgi:hypothetical protein